MRLKLPAWLFILCLLTTACAPTAAGTPTATAVPTRENEAVVVPSVAATAIPATEAAGAPKHKDLLFVEFFAIT